MTLILTQISKHGIIHASDSNLSNDCGQTVGCGQKCFVIPKLNAGLTVAGSFGVGSEKMDDWMNNFIEKSSSSCLKDFAEELRASLEKEMTKEQKNGGSLMHIAGYQKNKNGKYYPEFWFVRNIMDINRETGEYLNIKQEFVKTEDFWTRDNKNSYIFRKFQTKNGDYQLYINGFTSGRVSYNIIQGYLMNFFRNLWSNKNYNFRPPKNIKEAKLLIENYMKLINTLFILSDYPGQPIGGDIQMHAIPQPKNIDI
jgi:hypothetical protein